MATYFVTTTNHGAFAIDADYYKTGSFEDFHFFTKEEDAPEVLVASVPGRNVLTVSLDDAWGGFIEDDEDEKQEFLESEEFWDAVCNVIDAWHSDPDDGPGGPEYNHPEAAE